jgi:phosphoglycerate-specific signal transduction histidine kinase
MRLAITSGTSCSSGRVTPAGDHLRDTSIKLAKASRLATIAELAASIAHELNQPLMSILANAQAAKRWLNAAPPNVTEVNSSIERVIRDARAADETMQHIRANRSPSIRMMSTFQTYFVKLSELYRMTPKSMTYPLSATSKSFSLWSMSTGFRFSRSSLI